MLNKSQANFEYDCRLTQISDNQIYPTLCILRNKETNLRFVPAQKMGDVYKLPYIVSAKFGTTTCHKNDLKYFGIEELPEYNRHMIK